MCRIEVEMRRGYVKMVRENFTAVAGEQWDIILDWYNIT